MTLEKFPAEYSSLRVTLVGPDGVEVECAVQGAVRMGDLTQLDVLTPAPLVEGSDPNPDTSPPPLPRNPKA